MHELLRRGSVSVFPPPHRRVVLRVEPGVVRYSAVHDTDIPQFKLSATCGG